MYFNSLTQRQDFTVSGWTSGAFPPVPNQDNFYKKVIANDCRTCHIAQPFLQLQFNTADRFLNLGVAVSGLNNRLMLGTAQMRVCGDYVMPHALRTHDIFWDVY
jgi:hypothetical protein